MQAGPSWWAKGAAQEGDVGVAPAALAALAAELRGHVDLAFGQVPWTLKRSWAGGYASLTCTY